MENSFIAHIAGKNYQRKDNMKDFPKTIEAQKISSLLHDAFEATKQAGREFPCREFKVLEERIHKVWNFSQSVRQVLQDEEDKSS